MIRPSEKRPVFLDLRKIHMPLAARVSILHRLTGLLLIVSVPVLLGLLERSLSGETGFESVGTVFDSFPGGLLLFVFLWAFFHHLCAGIRYLLIDIDIGVDRQAMVPGARAVLVAGLVLALVVWVALP